jgi:hypothetical protein
MQFEEHILLKVHSNHMHINLRKGKLELGIGHSILYGYTNITGLNTISRMMPHFALYAICSRTKKGRARVLKNLP